MLEEWRKAVLLRRLSPPIIEVYRKSTPRAFERSLWMRAEWQISASPKARNGLRTLVAAYAGVLDWFVRGTIVDPRGYFRQHNPRRMR